MSLRSLEERVLDLERTVAELVQSQRRIGRGKEWRRTVGMFTGDEVMKRIDSAAAKYRAQDRQRARRRWTKRRQTRK